MLGRPVTRTSLLLVWLPLLAAAAPSGQATRLRAGAATVDITPTQFPVLVNGGFQPVVANQASDKLNARCLVLDDTKTKLAICVVDSCLMPRDLLDEAKKLASQSTGIPVDRMLVSATHTHSAPAVMGVLGTDVDPHYPPVLKAGVVKAIEEANRNIEPAKVAWGVSNAADYTATRRWIRRPDRMLRDPFGELTVRANMHPGHLSADAIGPSGPEDPDLTVLSVQRADGTPQALLANFAMHYFSTGVKPVSSDYFGLFAEKVGKRLGAANSDEKRPPFVGIMSQGTSGDAWRMDYGRPREQQPITIDQYADDLARLAIEAVAKANHRGDVSLAMAQKEIKVKSRGPDDKRLEWAKKVLAEMGDRPPKTQPEVYAREQMLLSQRPEADLLVQAIRVGDFGITALPNEVFALTGLKIKARSPLRPTMNIELANDELGYIPPPEQHKLGGYTTWPARSSYPDVDAEPRMVEAVLKLLEEVSGKPRRPMSDPVGPYAKAVLSAKPLAAWRMGDAVGPQATDASGNNGHGVYEDGVVFYLEGPASPAFSGEGIVNRVAHFAGGRMKADLPDLGGTYTVELWFWNGLPGEARAVAGYLFSRGPDGDKAARGDHLGIGGTQVSADRLIFFNGNKAGTVLSGTTTIQPRTWNHVVLSRDGNKATVYLNGNPRPEIEGEAEVTAPRVKQVFVGGRSDNLFNFEGKIDEVAVYGRASGGAEVERRFKDAGVQAPPAAASGAILQPPPPLSPQQSLKVLHVKDGYEVELVAAEPLVLDPIALAWGSDGKLWVVEMADYPYGADGRMKPAGRVRFLEDTDGDGKYDRGTVFIEDLNFPTGVMPWRKGVLISAAPDILYAEDTDGDGKADKREVLYTGFTQGNPQLRMNGFAWGLDNWVHVANGMSSQGKVRSTKTGAEVIVTNRDVRIRPDEGHIEAETGVSQFGRRPDDWGEWLGVHNSHPVRHFVIPERYARRNSHVTLPTGFDHATLPPNPKLYARSRIQKRYGTAFYQQSNVFTSACGIAPYRDGLLFGGAPAYGEPQHLFTCDPVHNLVQHLVLTPNAQGVTFTAARAKDEEFAEFMASEDQWFRPVFLASGPDGALWVADMYRYMIEHPDWLPPEGKEDYRPFYRLGTDKGRIYRVYPKGKKPRPFPRLDGLDTAGLVAALEAPSGWQRDTAQMMLLWRNDPAAAAPLERLAVNSSDPRSRLHALSTLDALGKLKADSIERALHDEHPAVRRQAVRLAESRAAKAPQLIAAAIRLADDPDPRVRLQLAFTLGEWDAPEAGAALAKLALTAGDDAYMTGAVMSSATRHYRAIADAMLNSGRSGSPIMRDLLAMSLAVGDRELTARLLEPMLVPPNGHYTGAQLEQFGRFLDHLAQHRTSIWKLMEAAQDPLTERLRQAGDLFESARRFADDPNRPTAERAAAVALLARDDEHLGEDVRRLAALMADPGHTHADVQAAAVRALGRVDRPEVPALLTAGWEGLPPQVRSDVLDVLLAREPGAWHLLKAVEAKQVAAADLDVPRRQRLISHASPRVKTLARELLGEAADASTGGRMKAVEAYRPALAAGGDAKRGEKVFLQHCATCHRLGAAGQEVGPNLESVRGWPPDALLTSILDPNRAAEPRYLAFTATTNDGETIQGVTTAETPAAVTMKSLDGKERVIPRSSLKSFVNTTRSFMPEGLEAAITPEQMADLIRFIQSP